VDCRWCARSAPSSRRPRTSTAEQRREADAYVAALRRTPYAPTASGALSADVLEYIEDAGEAVRTGGGVVFAADAYGEMVARIRAHLEGGGTITLGQVRDMFGTSRKYAQSLLEHLDAQRITRRVGDERVLR
jgi:selenocysteine-specific elongation factor